VQKMPFIQWIRNKKNTILDRLNEKYTTSHVIDLIEKSLMDSNLICSSFEDMSKGRVNHVRKRKQVILYFILVIMTPRYIIHSLLFAVPNKETREYYQFVCLDFMETLPLFLGRILNGIHLGGVLLSLTAVGTLNYFESKGKLQFFSHFRLFRRESQEERHEYQEETKLSRKDLNKLRISMAIKHCVASILQKSALYLSYFIFLSGLTLYHLKYQSWVHTFFASILVIGCIINFESFVINTAFQVPMLIMNETEYFVLRGRRLKKEIQSLIREDSISDQDVCKVFFEMIHLSYQINKHNQVIR